MVDSNTAADGKKLAAAIDRVGPTVMQATPATWQMVCDSGWSGRADLKVLCGGEPLSGQLARRLKDRVHSLWNMYGPTETTVWSTCCEITDASASVHIGRPIANTQVYVLDRNGNPTPVGVPGEIHIGGSGVADGYLGREDLTAARFIPDPFRATPGARLYRTGDLGRWRSDGQLEHLGRIDRQVKVRGFRIEPGEVEAVLVGHPAVGECFVESREIGPDDVRLIAFIVFDGRPLTATEVRRFLRTKLPDYMVPSFVVALDTVPLTPNGKVDRARLPDPLPRSRTALATYSPPSTPTEHAVAEVWQELLRVERIGRDDNFFDLGGHSLLSMQAVARIEDAVGHRPEPRTLFFQTLAQIAASVPSVEETTA